MSTQTKTAAPVRTGTAEDKPNRQQASSLNARRKPTLGSSLFHDPLFGAYRLGDIRQNLEIKLAACLATGGTNGFPVLPHRVKNPQLRRLITAGMMLQNWSKTDLMQCTPPLDGAAGLALIATLETPTWGAGDYRLFELLESIEALQAEALTGGLTL